MARMNLQSLSLLAVFCATASAETIIGGITFDDDAFADVVLDAMPLGTGHFARETVPPSGVQGLDLPADRGILESAVTGSDTSTGVSLRTGEAKLTVGFTDLIPVDGVGEDIAIFDFGGTETMFVTIADSTQQFTFQPTGEPNINAILVDLGSFGVRSTREITISADGIFNDIAAFGAINSVPEPASFVLLIAGLIGIAIRRRHLGQ